ncbi:phosphoinositide-3-kinase, regulatory subunit 4 [Dermatophagoides pteronyssinus]|uniref:non-specific serine/threonine protein kinase n=1 Tax=Dermatophagoides pteronyssinus TaxID=6956 RepID=A0ABQ8JRV1_DERPT|nr:phosphoinositide-3-kinase, regulatory subunit 4 [Dermatophagoides pteronyssinus]
MGNQLVSSVKTVIRPIDYYLNEVPDFKYKCSLGQTQFLKVALCSHNEGDTVVKVLSHEDPSILLEQYKKDLLNLAKLTAKNVSIASFRIVEIRTNFAYMARQFVRYSLYDRLSTRPFMTDIEKAWIVYQILRCLQWCHNYNIYHGDLKLENILVTSNLWVIVSDFASYKPIRLPEDNPTFFNYFFDTSRRRCCNIAPERFISSSSNQSNNSNQADTSMATSYIQQQNTNIFNLFLQEGQLTPKMDMFSLGCILAEIYSDNYLFDLGAILNYKDKRVLDSHTEESLERIQNESMRNVVRNLINLDPQQRFSCEQVLAQLQNGFFPSYFDELYSLMENLIRLPPDAKVLYLRQYIDYYLNVINNENAKATLILLMALTSSIRSLKHIFCKIEAQRLICRMAMSSSILSPFIIDRLIPYLVNGLTDCDHRVRGESIDSITLLLEYVTRLPSSDNNLFTDYLMEKFQKCIGNEKNTFVRICMARNIGRLSKIALDFLNQYCDHNYDEELNLLHKYFQNLVSILITDPNNCVRRVLLLTPQNCSQLCTFFGRQKTNDVILSHIITFLNDKCSAILHPLLQHGLCDAEEIIVAKTITSIAYLVEQGLIAKNVIIELLREIMPLIYHPNRWITNAIIHFLRNLQSHLLTVDLNTKVLPILSSFFKLNVKCFTVQLFHRRSVEQPIPRPIYEAVLMAKDQEVLISFFNLLEKKLSYPDYDISLLKHNIIYKRLLADNITPVIEQQLFALRDLLIKIYRNKRNYQPMVRDCETLSNFIYLKHYHMMRTREVQLFQSNQFYHQTGNDDQASSANQEWLHMFGPNNHLDGTPHHQQQQQQAQHTTNEPRLKPHEMKDVEPLLYECPPYLRDVEMLEQHKKNNFIPFASVMNKYQSPMIRPMGYLVAHLYEHKSSVNRMTAISKTNMFVTCSDDGSIRLWDLCDDPSRYVISRSRFQFRLEFQNGSPVNFKGMVNCGQFIIAYSNDCQLHAFEMGQSQFELTCAFKIGSIRASVPYLITSICALSETMFAVSLSDSWIYVYDTRYFYTPFFNVPVMKMSVPPSHRVITAIDGDPLALYAATALGFICGLDLRFQLKIFNVIYNSAEPTRIAQLKHTPSGLYTSVFGNYDVTHWDLNLLSKNRILTASNSAKTSEQSSSSSSSSSSGAVVNAILPLVTQTTTQAIIAAGSDMKIRYWDLMNPEQSYIISDPIYKACNYCYLNKSSPTTLTKHQQQQKQKPFSHPPSICSIDSNYYGPSSTSQTGSSSGSASTFNILPSSSSSRKPDNVSSTVSSSPSTTTTLAKTSSTLSSSEAIVNNNSGGSNSNNLLPLTTYQQILQDDGVFRVMEMETSSMMNKLYQEQHHCPMDQQLMSFAHQDSITDLININQYLVSCGRNGAVKVWR